MEGPLSQRQQFLRNLYNDISHLVELSGVIDSKFQDDTEGKMPLQLKKQYEIISFKQMDNNFGKNQIWVEGESEWRMLMMLLAYGRPLASLRPKKLDKHIFWLKQVKYCCRTIFKSPLLLELCVKMILLYEHKWPNELDHFGIQWLPLHDYRLPRTTATSAAAAEEISTQLIDN